MALHVSVHFIHLYSRAADELVQKQNFVVGATVASLCRKDDNQTVKGCLEVADPFSNVLTEGHTCHFIQRLCLYFQTWACAEERLDELM